MKIVVCLKQILDPEIPPSSFEIDGGLKQAIIGKHALVINPFDENALEMALQLKDKKDDVHITALTYGGKRAEDALRKAFGVLADESVHILKEDDILEQPYLTANVLARAIKRICPIDLIMCGRQAGDWDAGTVPSLIAEELGVPSLSFISQMETANGDLILKREVEGGTEVFESSMPALVTVTNNESNVLRIAKVKDVMKAHRKTIMTLTEKELDPEKSPVPMSYADLNRLYIPIVDNVCEIIEGDEPEEKVTNLLKRLRDRKVL